jgi:hypothetical protein
MESLNNNDKEYMRDKLSENLDLFLWQLIKSLLAIQI